MGRLQDKRLFLLDMDGTIYLDDRLFGGVTAFLSRIRETVSGTPVLRAGHPVLLRSAGSGGDTRHL